MADDRLWLNSGSAEYVDKSYLDRGTQGLCQFRTVDSARLGFEKLVCSNQRVSNQVDERMRGVTMGTIAELNCATNAGENL